MNFRIRVRFLVAALAAAGAVLPAAGAVQARTAFVFLPAHGPAPQAAELQDDLLARLERTRRYGIERAAAGEWSSACGRPGAEKAARLVLARAAKFEARVEVFDCASKKADPPRIAARSAKLASLASSLRSDFLAAYPLVLSLGLDAGRLWVDAGPEERIFAGTLLYSYSRAGGRNLDLVRVLAAEVYEGNSFRSLLIERFRVPGGSAPAAGEILSPVLLLPRPPRALRAPVLAGHVARRRLWAAPEFLAAASPPLEPGPAGEGLVAPSGKAAWPAPSARTPGVGESFSLQAALGSKPPLVLGFRITEEKKGRRGYEAAFSRDEITVARLSPKGRREVLLRKPWRAPRGPARIRLAGYGAWHELYVAGEFVAGFEDFSSLEGGYEVSGPPGLVLSGPEIFEIEPLAGEALSGGEGAQ